MSLLGNINAQALIQAQALPRILQQMNAKPEVYQQAGLQAPEQKPNSVLSSPAFSQALASLAQGISFAQANRLGFGAGLARGAAGFSQVMAADTERKKQAERQATEDLLALIKDDNAMKMREAQLELSRRADARAGAAAGRAQQQFDLQLQDRQKRNEALQNLAQARPDLAELIALDPDRALDIYDDQFAPKEAPTPYTDMGKLTMDYKNGLIDDEQFKARSNEILKGDVQDNFKPENDLRDEYNTLSKDYFNVQGSYSKVKASSEDPSPAGDLALIFNFMKMQDPGSVVREGEFANAQNAGGVSDKTRAAYNNVLKGTRLTEKQRTDFVKTSEKLLEAAEGQQDIIRDRYKEMSERYGLNADNVITPRAAKPDTTAAVNKTIDGVNYVQIDGQWYEASN